MAHNGSGFDSYIVLNNLPLWRIVTNLIRKSAGIVSLKIVKGYVIRNKKTPQYVLFRCGRVHLINFRKK